MKTESPRTKSVTAFEPFEKSSPNVVAKNEDESLQRRRCCSQKAWAITLIVMGSLSVLGSILYGTAVPAIVGAALEDDIVYCTTSEVLKENYVDPFGDCDDCSPYYVSMYMFNATNAEEFLATNTKLQVQEMGPYVYRRREIKLDVVLSNDASTVSYKTYTYHTYETDKSCAGCSDTDEIISFDTGYFSAIAATGGEFNLLATIAAQSFALNASLSEITAIVNESGEQMMRWLNGLNSLDPVAMKTVTTNTSILQFLTSGPNAIAHLDLSGFAFNGLFVKRLATQWALGYPSMLAGLLLGANYINTCQTSMNAMCSSCSGSSCLNIATACTQCAQGAALMAVNTVTCGLIESIYAAKYGETEATSFVATTCRLCETIGLCAAPLPGTVESSGLDYSRVAPNASTLQRHVKRTGCDDDSKIGTYVEYNGFTVAPIWADLNERRNPTLAELNAFSRYANCASPVANITCYNVSGTDGAALKPGGVTIHGMAKHTTADSLALYSGAIKSSVTFANMNTKVDLNGVSLHRFGTPSNTFNYTDQNAAIGTGIPLDGLHQLSFITGFLTYLSGPFFIYSDTSLLEAVEMINSEGTVMTANIMYESDGSLVDSFRKAYTTFLDIEAGTGLTLRVRKRSQISFAVAGSSAVSNASMSDLVWPTLQTEVILPTYWVEEAAEAKDSILDKFKSTLTFVKTFLPALIVLIVVGVLELGGGLLLWRRHKVQAKELHYI
ncbi:croquemort-like mating protein [Plasmopara halstedii]|uniref:Croquemort-like mating protein n=1 Tax=Plasmopara halstedii TaxID=4781 RepID=A0A0P1AM24_PLAHL|nr:croquemort-like mating protein [Plasmopara halstedii]CEG42484.1 croquemort-like mating protein [Plasmopara halstedii]|eukprot:XP_024578853.1 croquemort-like mating protein [Plasmopara halstedii]